MQSQRVAAYRLLGIPLGSDRTAVVRAYRRLARTVHPDVSTDPRAADRFAELTEAYRVASRSSRAAGERSADSSADQIRVTVGHETAAHDAAGDPWGVPRVRPMPRTPRGWQRPPIVAGPTRVRPIQQPRNRRGGP